ncbi:hypothetical protein LCGC14_0680170 [marine sediment metagenome]|uniref:Uncharacterized protein n=1 Tax=marine sediment metagenome TaxID=412755 RepID=A0A0F9QTA3_9ZZZZ
MDKAKLIKEQMDALRDIANKKDYIFRDYSVNVVSKKINDEKKLDLSIALMRFVSEEINA